MNEFSIIQYLIGASKVKFSILEEIFKNVKIKQDHILLYIDAHAIFYRLYRNQAIKAIENMNSDVFIRDVVIGFINVLGHYRRFFATRLNKDTTIIVSFNRNPPIYQNTLYNGFHSNYNDLYSITNKDYSVLNKLIQKAYKLICSVVPYFEGIYCIQLQNVDDLSIAYRAINDNSFNIIYSKNLLATQLLSDNIIQFFNKKDNSFLITKETCYINGVMRELKTTASDKLQPKDLLILWALGGCTSVKMKPTKWVGNFSKATRIINQLIDDNKYYQNMALEEVINTINNDSKTKYDIDIDVIQKRYQALNIKHCAKAMTKDQLTSIRADLYDIFDQQELENMNEQLAEVVGSNEELLNITSLNMSKGQRWFD